MRKIFFAIVLTLMLLVSGTNMLAQRITGSIAGRVEDPSGAAITGANVTISSAATGFKLELTTSSVGSFSALDLAPGEYTVRVKMAGFSEHVQGAVVRVGVATPITAKMEVGAATVEVTVAGSTVNVDTEKQTVQGIITADRIEQIPLNGRNFLQLAALEPGVQVVSGGTFDPTKNGMTAVSVGGRTGRVTRIQVDGVDITDETVGTTVANLSNESIEEFGISQSSLDPSTDRTSSGAVNIITRSGTNGIHGSSFFQDRHAQFAADQRLDKRDPSTGLSSPKPDFDRQIEGFRVGGPFFKDKLFWFANYERNNTDAITSTAPPSFPGFSGSFATPFDEREAGGRLDWNITSRAKFFYRYTHDDNLGVTGFGGIDLDAFANKNSTNWHVAGLDFSTTHWAHQVRFSYLKFINGIVDANKLAGTPETLDPLGRPLLIRIRGHVIVGPNANAPQATFQQNKQTKYDASHLMGKHTLRFGGEYNKIDEAGFAKFFANGSRVSSRITELDPAPPFSGGGANPLNYDADQIRVSNGLGFGSEKAALGFPHGGFINHRLGFYAQDSWKVTPRLTFNAGVRYLFDTGITNHDLHRTPLLAQFDPKLARQVNRPNKDFAPQAGFAWNVRGDGKTVIRGGAGIFYETNVFNNILFDRGLNIPPGLAFDEKIAVPGDAKLINPSTGATLFDFDSDCADVGGSCFGVPIGSIVGDVTTGTGLFQSASAALAASWPPSGVPPLFNQNLSTGGSLLTTDYKTPRSYQFNIGIQRELRPGLVLSADYLYNKGVHFNQVVDHNRLGAARFLNLPLAQSAITATEGSFGCADVDCVIAAGGTISDFADNGLGKGSALDGEAFSGTNPNFRDIGTIDSIGISLYRALELRLTGRLGSWGPFRDTSVNINYALSRYENSAGGADPQVADPDFLTTSVNNDSPTKFFGPGSLDRTHQVGISFSTELPWGFRVSTATALKSALANPLFVNSVTGGTSGPEIFFTDFNGDGTVQDPIPGTNNGAFGRSVKAGDLNKLITSFNNTVAGTFTPAAKTLIDKGLFTSDQLTALGAVIQPIPLAPTGQVNNDSFINTDVRISKVFKIKERLTIEPQVEVFNLFNVSNYEPMSQLLDGTPSSPNGTTKIGLSAADWGLTRVGATTGSFSPGIQRAFQFGIRVTF